jgi:hypothetical protein
VSGADLERGVRPRDDRIEQRLERGACPEQGPEPPAPPARSHGDASFEPWELVSV